MTSDATASLQRILVGLAGAETQDADLVLMQLDPQPARLLDLCAIPHLFDSELVRVLDPQASLELIEIFMGEVQSLPSVRQLGDSFALHDTVRSQLFERWLQPLRHTDFVTASLRLAEHYEGTSRSGGQAEAEANEPVVMFHRIGANLEAGFGSFQNLYRRYRESARYSACDGLVRLVAEYHPILSDQQRSWLTFYDAETARDVHDLERAVLLLTELTRQEPEPALAIRVHVNLSAVLRGLRRLEAAREQARLALQLASAYPEGGALAHLAHQELGLIARDEGDVEKAGHHLRLALELGTATGDRLVVASAYNGLGTVLQKFDPRQAIMVLESGAAQLEGDALRRAQVLNNLGLAYANVGDWAKSQQSFQWSLEIKRAAADLYGQALTLLNVARVYQARRQPFAARNALIESATLFETVRDSGSAAAARRELARVLRLAGEAEQAMHEAATAVRLFEQTGRGADAQALRWEFALKPTGSGGKAKGIHTRV
jgi:tetratricopeptide (TPR) repeat protein